MQNKPDHFLCLADYWCRCDPAGKPVNETTMVRHRKLCNELRATRGLEPLGRGPRHSVSREIEEYERRLSMDPSSNPANPLCNINNIDGDEHRNRENGSEVVLEISEYSNGDIEGMQMSDCLVMTNSYLNWEKWTWTLQMKLKSIKLILGIWNSEKVTQ